jgi:hypothetical protein
MVTVGFFEVESFAIDFLLAHLLAGGQRSRAAKPSRRDVMAEIGDVSRSRPRLLLPARRSHPLPGAGRRGRMSQIGHSQGASSGSGMTPTMMASLVRYLRRRYRQFLDSSR